LVGLGQQSSSFEYLIHLYTQGLNSRYNISNSNCWLIAIFEWEKNTNKSTELNMSVIIILNSSYPLNNLVENPVFWRLDGFILDEWVSISHSKLCNWALLMF